MKPAMFSDAMRYHTIRIRLENRCRAHFSHAALARLFGAQGLNGPDARRIFFEHRGHVAKSRCGKSVQWTHGRVESSSHQGDYDNWNHNDDRK